MKIDQEWANKEIERIIESLKQTLHEAHAKGYVLGMSGGIDCSFVAAVLNKGNIPFHLIAMPNDRSMDGVQMQDAKWVAEQFNKRQLEVIPITDIIQRICSDVASTNDHGNMEMAKANIGPRVRMTYLYTKAQMMNYLVVGTSNLSEIVMGYFTKWGDGAADCEPIQAYTKTEIRMLAKVIGLKAELIQKQPSAELWNGQTDEKEMGITYEELDNVIMFDQASDRVLAHVLQAIKRNRHKTKYLFCDLNRFQSLLDHYHIM